MRYGHRVYKSRSAYKTALKRLGSKVSYHYQAGKMFVVCWVMP